MRFKLLIIFFFVISCTSNYTKLENRKPFNSKGFAYIYNNEDINNYYNKYSYIDDFIIQTYKNHGKLG